MELINATKFTAGYTLGMDPDGRERVVVVVKGTYELPTSELALQPNPVEFGTVVEGPAGIITVNVLSVGSLPVEVTGATLAGPEFAITTDSIGAGATVTPDAPATPDAPGTPDSDPSLPDGQTDPGGPDADPVPDRPDGSGQPGSDSGSEADTAANGEDPPGTRRNLPGEFQTLQVPSHPGHQKGTDRSFFQILRSSWFRFPPHL